jgi:hypothetical protein
LKASETPRADAASCGTTSWGRPSIAARPLARARRQVNELSDDMAMRISIYHYMDAREALVKGLDD